MYIMYILLAYYGNAQVLHSISAEGYNGTVAGSRKSADVPSFMINQASLPEVKGVSAVVYTEKRYLLKELASGSIAIAFPVHGGGVGVAAGLSGFAGYNESQMSIAYGKALGKSISIGTQISYNTVHAEGYGNASAIGFEAGAAVQATDKLYTGIHICNPAGGQFGHASPEKLASIYTIVFGYEVSGNLLLSVQTRKTENKPVDILFAIHYAFATQFFIRAGTATSSGNSFAGIGLSWKNFRMDLIGSYHLQLGVTPALQLIVHSQKEEE